MYNSQTKKKRVGIFRKENFSNSQWFFTRNVEYYIETRLVLVEMIQNSVSSMKIPQNFLSRIRCYLSRKSFKPLAQKCHENN